MCNSPSLALYHPLPGEYYDGSGQEWLNPRYDLKFLAQQYLGKWKEQPMNPTYTVELQIPNGKWYLEYDKPSLDEAQRYVISCASKPTGAPRRIVETTPGNHTYSIYTWGYPITSIYYRERFFSTADEAFDALCDGYAVRRSTTEPVVRYHYYTPARWEVR